MKYKFLIVAILFLATIQLGVAQPASSKIGGKVLDEEGLPIPYATVFLNHSKLSTCTNDDGRFLLNAPGLPETVSISSIGFYNNERVIFDTKVEQRYILKKKAVDLKEVYVFSVTAAEIIKQALERVSENYQDTPFIQGAFIRHSIKSNNQLLYVDEFTCKALKSYKPEFNDQYFIQKKRIFKPGNSKFHYNVIGIGWYDVVKRRKQFFDNSFFRNHILAFQTSSIYDNRPVYVISIKSKQRSEGINGLLYIDQSDLAFVYLKVKTPVFEFLSQYKKLNGYYTLMTGHGERINHYPFNRSDNDHLVISDFVVNQAVLPFEKDSLQGVQFERDDLITEFSKDALDTSVWDNFNQLLPNKEVQVVLDSISRFNSFKINGLSNISDSANSTYAYTNLLHPQSLFIGSIKFNSNMSALSQNRNAFDVLADHYLIRSNYSNVLRLLLSYAYHECLSAPLSASLADYQILRSNGLRPKLTPYSLNSYGFAYNNGILASDMSSFQRNNISDFLRIHTTQYESNFLASKQLEEQLAGCDLGNAVNKWRMYNYYYSSLLIKKYYQLYSYTKKDIKEKAWSETKQPIIIDKNRSWVHYLFNPNAPFKRHITQSDLSSKEIGYLKTSSNYSLINLLSPQIFGLKKFSIWKKEYTFSLSYLPISYGRFFEQTFWQKTSTNLSSLTFRQYDNFEKRGFGLGYKRYDDKLLKNLYLTSELNLWQQPKSFSFYDKIFQNGVQLCQMFRLNAWRDKYLGQRKVSLLLGYDFKSNGYVPGNLSLKKSVDLMFGVSYNLK
jgi:hypothetical protein